MMSQESEERLVDITVPGRYVLYPKNITKEQAELVLLQPSSTPVKFYGNIGVTMYGIPFTNSDDSTSRIFPQAFNFCFMFPELPNGVGIALYQKIEPEHIIYLNRAFDSLKEWFKKYAVNIEPKFLDIRKEINKYLKSYRVYPVARGFVEWFIAHKIGGFKATITVPFDEEYNWISGGVGVIKYSFADLWRIVDTRIDSNYIYEYLDFRQRQEDDLESKRKKKRQIENFNKELDAMKNKRITINRKIVTDFIEAINPKLILKMSNEGNPYTPILKDYLNEMLIIAERAMLDNEPLSVYNAIVNAISHAEKEIRRLEFKKDGGYVRDSAIAVTEAKAGLKSFNIVLDFWTLLRKEYTSTLQSVESSVNSKDLTEATSLAILKTNHDEIRIAVREILAPLGGYNPRKEKIMNDEVFSQLIEYTDYLVINDLIPNDIKVIQQINISTKHIRYTFYRLHKRLFTTSTIRTNFILFLHSVFRQFENVQDSTTRTKFSEKPTSYFRDFGLPEEVI